MEVNKYVFTSGVCAGKSFEEIYKINKKYIEWWGNNNFGYNNKTQNLINEFLETKKNDDCRVCFNKLGKNEKIENKCSCLGPFDYCHDCYITWHLTVNKCAICRKIFPDIKHTKLIHYLKRTKTIYEKIKPIIVIILKADNDLIMMDLISKELEKENNKEILNFLKISFEEFFISGYYKTLGKMRQNKTTYLFNEFMYFFNDDIDKVKKYKFVDIDNILGNIKKTSFLSAYYLILYAFNIEIKH